MLSREKLNKGWCQGHLAVDRNGNACAAHSHLAVAWSLEGSIIQASSYFNRYDDWLDAVIEVWAIFASPRSPDGMMRRVAPRKKWSR